MKFHKILFSISLLILCFISSISFSQTGNTNGQYDDAIKQAYILLQYIQNQDKNSLKEKFTETSFQTKKEFSKMLNSSNIKWANNTINQNGIPEKGDLLISGWKTVSKESQSTFYINITFFFKGKNVKYTNSDDHICFNFFKNQAGEYCFNGIMFFKKEDFIKAKKITN